MMNNNMKKLMSVFCGIGAAIVCLVMLLLEVINKDIPALVWLTFAMVMFANVAINNPGARSYGM